MTTEPAPEFVTVGYAGPGDAAAEALWRERVIWMLAGAVGWSALSSVARIVSDGGWVVSAAAGLDGWWLAAAAVGAEAVGWVAAAVLGVLAYRYLRGGRLGFGAMIWIVVALVLNLAGMICWSMSSGLVAGFVSSTNFRDSVYVRSYASLAKALLVPVIVGWIAIRLYRRGPR